MISNITFYLTILLLLFNTGSSNGSELILNGDFENEAAWKDNSRWADVDVKYSKIFSKERNGFIQKINCEKFNYGAVQFVQDGISIRNGGVYRVTFWAKGNLDSPLVTLLRKQGTPYTTYFSKGFRITDRWNKYTFVAPVHTNDSSAFFMFTFTSKGELLLDDVSVTPVIASKSKPKHRDGNLLANGNFEIGTDNWGVNFRGLGYENEMPVRAMQLRAKIDTTRSKYDKHSLKIPSVKNSRFVLNSGNIILSPGKNHSLSLWAYSETVRKLRIGIRSGYFSNTTETMKTISVGPGWKRYEISTTTKPSEDNAYFVAVEGNGKGDVWIDGVQLEEGNVKSFSNIYPFEIGIVKQNYHPLFILNERISLPVRIASYGDADNCRVKINSIDYYGEMNTILSTDCDIENGSSRVIDVEHPSDETGHFRLLAEILQNGKIVDTSEYAIGIIQKLPDTAITESIASPFGGHVRFSLDNLNALSRLGVKWLRMHPPHGTKWSVIEKNKGQYKFYDKEILLAKEAGFHILGSLDKTPRWASDAPEGEKQFWSYPPKNLDDWENYVFNIVSRYKGIIDYWEVWNEPDSTGFLKIPGAFGAERKPAVYVELLKRAYRAAKKANPEAIIIGGCTTGKPPSHWLKKIFDKGALAYMDIVSFHYYTGGIPGDTLDTTIGSHINEIRKLIKQKSGKPLRIWETESGVMYPKTSYTNLKEISPSYQVPDKEAVAYLIRNYVHLLSSGVEKWFYYSMMTFHRIDRISATGFFEWDGAPRPLAVAYAVLASNIENLEYADNYTINNNVNVTKFVGNNRDVIIVSAKSWPEEEMHSISLETDSPYKHIIITNAMGKTVDSLKFGEKLEIDVGREPLYLTVYKK